MKKQLFALLLLAGTTVAAEAQSIAYDKVPPKVVNGVREKFPITDNIDWRIASNYYEAAIDGPGKMDTWLRFDPQGNFVMQKDRLDIFGLPDPITSLIRKEYANYKVRSTEKVTHGSNLYYQVKLTGSGKSINLVIKPNGEVDTKTLYWEN